MVQIQGITCSKRGLQISGKIEHVPVFVCEREAERDRDGERKWSSHAIRARVWQQQVVSAQI